LARNKDAETFAHTRDSGRTRDSDHTHRVVVATRTHDGHTHTCVIVGTHRSAWKRHMLETKHVTREGIRYYDDKVAAGPDLNQREREREREGGGERPRETER
jgi:hypothetical protein